MLIIGCDYHPSVQQIAVVHTETGDYGEHRLKHSDGEAEKFYAIWQSASNPGRINKQYVVTGDLNRIDPWEITVLRISEIQTYSRRTKLWEQNFQAPI